MAMKVSRHHDFAISVSADNLVCRYDLEVCPHIRIPNTDMKFVNKAAIKMSQNACVAHKTKHPGNSSIAIREDGKVCAIGGWDGRLVLVTPTYLNHINTRRPPPQHSVILNAVDEAARHSKIS
jgi:hypothetical protein